MISSFVQLNATGRQKLTSFCQLNATKSDGKIRSFTQVNATVGIRKLAKFVQLDATGGSPEWLRVFRKPGTGQTGSDSPITGPGYPLDFRDYTVAAEDCLIPDEEFVLRLDGTDYSSALIDFSYGSGRNQGASGSLQLLDHDGKLAEAVSSYSPQSEDFRAHDMTSDRFWTAQPKQAGRGPKLPYLLPGDPSWDGSSVTTVNFTDFGPLVALENQYLPGVLYDEGDRETAHSVLADLVALAGVSYVTRFPDYPIRNFRFSGSLTSGMDELAGVYQAYRMWDGGRLVFDRLREKSPVAKLRDRFHIPANGGFTASTATSGMKTFFRAQRTNPMPTALSSPVSGKDVGRVIEITFQRPVYYASIRAQARHGTIEAGVFYDEDNNPVGQGGFEFFGGGRTAKTWRATYHPKFTRTEFYVPYWRVQAFGGTPPSSSGGAFFVEAAVGTAEGIYGRRQEYRNLTSDLFLDEATAQTLLDSIATEVEWSVRRFRLQTPFLVPGREGDFLGVEYYPLSIDEDFLIDRVNLRWSPDKGYSNTYELRGKL